MKVAMEAQVGPWKSNINLIESRLQLDKRYYPYMALIEIDENNAFARLKKNMHLIDSQCRSLLIEAYDMAGAIAASLNDMRSDLFRDLSPPERKMTAINQIIKYFELFEDRANLALDRIEHTLSRVANFPWTDYVLHVGTYEQHKNGAPLAPWWVKSVR